jgi:hypothetical protein
MRYARPAPLLGMVLLAVAACGGGSSASRAPSIAATATSTAVTASSAAPGMTGATSTINGASLGGPVQPGETLCGLLGPGDFTAAGVPGAGVPSLNGNGATEAYCVYAGTSSATGGIEFDAFTGTTADAASTYATVLGQSATGQPAAADLAGVEQASIDLGAEGGSVTVVVRAGRLVFDIGFPKTGAGRNQLLVLAKLVLDRATALR